MKQQLGHYDLIAELGRGGMGVVYKGHEHSLDRYVAIKVLAESLAHDASVKERFLREARSMAALNDPHIIQIYFIGEEAGQTYFVMEFVEGESLSSLLKHENKLKPEQAAKIIYQTAQGLATAHDKGVIHRDIKPGNLMITNRGNVKIADFGIALVTRDFSKKLTTTGEFVGTPGYLSPEVCLGKLVDQRSDIFSLGIVLFECLAGRMPFTDESPLGLMLEVVKADIPDIRQLNNEVDPELSRILGKMIAKNPADRYQSCQELEADLAKHPLVAKGGPITVQTRISPAAATMVGQKTPVSGQRPLPNTTPTPQPMAEISHPTTPRGQSVIAPTHEPVLQRQRASAAKSSVLPWAIAAVLVLGLVGGAWAYRDQIPLLKQYLGGTMMSDTSNGTNGVATPANNDTGNTSGKMVAAIVASPPPTDAASADNSDAVQNETNNTNESPVAAANNPAVDASAIAATSNTDVVTTTAVARTVSADGGPAPRASRIEALRELAAAQASEAAPQQRLARVTEPAAVSAPTRPHIPTVAVIAGGDAAVSEPAEQAIEKMLSNRGYHLIDQNMLPRISHLLNGERPNFAAVLEVLGQNGKADAVVFVHARPVGTQEITYYGQSSTLYTVQLGVRAYSVSGQHMLGTGWNERVNFTSLNAAEKAKEAVEPMLDQVANKLTDYRAAHEHG